MRVHRPGVKTDGRFYQEASIPLRGALRGDPLGRCRFESMPGELAPIELSDVSEEVKGGEFHWTRA